eukprot:1159097-Pelagomonas_calceolata.AAC.12
MEKRCAARGTLASPPPRACCSYTQRGSSACSSWPQRQCTGMARELYGLLTAWIAEAVHRDGSCTGRRRAY